MSNEIAKGYGYEPPTGPYLRLKTKGEKFRLRLVSDPLHFHDVIPKGNPPDENGVKTDKIVTKTAWIAILKDEDGAPLRVVCYDCGPMIYKFVKALAENKQWGDPKLYDIEVVRTQVEGAYYSVSPLPRPIGPLTEREQQMVMDANLDLTKLCIKDIPAGASTGPAEEEVDAFAD